MRSLGLPASAFAASGKGESEPVASNDTPQGMAQNRRTQIRAWYEETLEVPGVAGTPPRSIETVVQVDDCAVASAVRNRDAAFSISIDGVVQDTDTQQQEADRQRCVDVALERSDIQVKYDPLNVSPALNVWLAAPYAQRHAPVPFGTYTNYAFFQQRAEIRIFIKGQSTQEQPFAIVPVAIGEAAAWQVPFDAPEQIGYLLRVYDASGKFDETRLQPLRLFDVAPFDAPAGASPA